MIKRLVFAVIMMALPAPVVMAQHQEGWVDDYRGVIGNHKIGISIMVLGSDVSGEYFYLRWLKDIPIKGKINGRKIVLNELDEKGKVVAVFDGHFPEHANVIEGEWFRPKGTERKKFRVLLEDSVGLTGDNRYYVAGFNNVQSVETVALQFKKAVIAENREKVASLVLYPVSVKINGKRVEIMNMADFIQRYEAIFNRAFFDRIKESVPHNMFVKAEGVMLGDSGEIWIGKRGGKARIIAINNDVKGL